ncbi:MAG TPA: MoaD/ThiS family protein [Magnetospirillaceae bacterium]|nr:MoaD/ThiS family protein [Magnetospirillaceae bacterium]
MKIILNDGQEEFPGDSVTVRQILDRKNWSFPLIIARVNGRPVDRKAWDSEPIRDGAEVELHHLLSGG